jgi:hypothetical protein
MRSYTFGLLSAVSRVVSGAAVASYSGYSVVWSDTFAGSAGAPPNAGLWNIAQR